MVWGLLSAGSWVPVYPLGRSMGEVITVLGRRGCSSAVLLAGSYRIPWSGAIVLADRSAPSLVQHPGCFRVCSWSRCHRAFVCPTPCEWEVLTLVSCAAQRAATAQWALREGRRKGPARRRREEMPQHFRSLA